MPDATPLFSVIIPVRNKWDLTSACLRRLRETTPEFAFEVLVVDNASDDATAGDLDALGKALFGTAFRAIHLPENRNFGPACNLGAREAAAPLLFFLNNDTLPTPGWAPPLVDALAHEAGLGAVGPLLLYADDTVQHVGVAFTTRHPLHLYRHFPAGHPAVRKRRYVQTLTAAALLLPRSLFLSIGGFFEAYRNGFEDVDLCLRLAARGQKMLCLPESVIYHLESQTPGRADANEGNARLMQERCGNLFHPDMHIHGLRDGFQPFLADTLDISLAMRAEEEAALLDQARGRPLSFWQERIRQNPLWLRGREHLAGLAEARGEYRLALLLRSEIAFWRKSREAYARLLALRNVAGPEEATLLLEAEKALRHVDAVRQDTALLRRQWRHARRWNDALLSRLFEQKMREFAADS